MLQSRIPKPRQSSPIQQNIPFLTLYALTVSVRIFFKATSSPVERSDALYTTPYVPAIRKKPRQAQNPKVHTHSLYTNNPHTPYHTPLTFANRFFNANIACSNRSLSHSQSKTKMWPISHIKQIQGFFLNTCSRKTTHTLLFNPHCTHPSPTS